MVDSVTTENALRTRRLQVRNAILRVLKQPDTAMCGCVQSDASLNHLQSKEMHCGGCLV